ncbi:type VI secretion system protein ImpG [Azospirillum fermentarium]|uniref:type VI secretion system baseplate subunit TssF n=1 Tax=Azospirillum fermentarium TaxID=1233114 RepID=UPI00222693FB|nr:type VI secretion system baseplate subunit TssF [Azospirillum fermentarium]MCW2249415.1 type VI secretion system protein ImpG [Azospirillum fermentarium]
MAGDEHDPLLPHYLREIAYLRREGRWFAAKYPKVASRLEFSGDESADPHVERLIESFAYLTARLQHNLDSEFLEIPASLLGVLFPQMMAPVPSMAIAKCVVGSDGGPLGGEVIPKGLPLYSETGEGVPCRFQTAWPLEMWPLRVTDARPASVIDYDLPASDGRYAGAVEIRVEGSGVPVDAQGFRTLRFFIGGDRVQASQIYEMLSASLSGIALVADDPRKTVVLPADALRFVGFEDDETVLPGDGLVGVPHRLVQEYFAFPDKFFFFEISGLERRPAGGALRIAFLFSHMPKRAPSVDAGTFHLGCVPVINLFRRTSEPIRITHQQPEYRVVADLRREATTEIHTVESIRLVSPGRPKPEVVRPYFALNHRAAPLDGDMGGDSGNVFWMTRRLAASAPGQSGTDLLLALVDLDFHPSHVADKVAYAEVVCTNRGLAERMTANTVLKTDETVPASRIVLLTKPSRQLAPPSHGETLWRLVSTLTVNRLSFGNEPHRLESLKEILRVYNMANTAVAEQQIEGIRSMDCHTVVRRLGRDAWRGFCRGTEVVLSFDERHYVGSSIFPFAGVLDRFFALHASMNAFTQLSIRSQQREGILREWPIRDGAGGLV